jgi:hypothetical protein
VATEDRRRRLVSSCGNASEKKEDAMPEWKDQLWTDAVELRPLPMIERIERTLREARPRVEPKPVDVAIDASTIARRNANGLWDAYDLAGGLVGKSSSLERLCKHTTPLSTYCIDCGR